MKKFIVYLAMIIIALFMFARCSSSQKIHKNGLYGKTNHRTDYGKPMYYCGQKTKAKKR